MKMGRKPHAVAGPRGILDAGMRENTMVVGADVTHPQKGSGCPSIAGVVATVNEHAALYFASARLQDGTEEVGIDNPSTLTSANARDSILLNFKT
jgi:hypothetical protein